MSDATERTHCPRCGTEEVDGGHVGYYCPKEGCWPVVRPEVAASLVAERDALKARVAVLDKALESALLNMDAALKDANAAIDGLEEAVAKEREAIAAMLNERAANIPEQKNAALLRMAYRAAAMHILNRGAK